MNEQKKIISHFKIYIEKYNYDIRNTWVEEIVKYADDGLVSLLQEKFYNYEDYSVENFIYNSESLFNENEKKNNGITFTPLKIVKEMIKLLFQNNDISSAKKLIDPAVGGGIFLLESCKYFKKKTKKKVKDIIEENLFGIDIMESNVLISKLSLVLYALEIKEEIPGRFNIFCLDSYRIIENPNYISAFDYVIVNPPYIRSKNLSKEHKFLIKNNFETSFGIIDSYIPFFEISLKLIKDNGTSTLITPNTYLSSLNGRKLRNYLIHNCKNINLINFSNQILFKNISSYSVITSVVKNEKQEVLPEIKYKLESLDEQWYPVELGDTWRTLNNIELNIIRKLENTHDTKLKNLKFKNGIATQRNNIYSFIYKEEDEDYYYFTKNDNKYKVEKGIVKSFITPNEKFRENHQKIIFPYYLDNSQNKNLLISEEEFKTNYPYAYKYLSYFKDELDKRATDKNITNWYAYGRAQGLNDTGARLYLPYMASKVHSIVSKGHNEVFAAGYAIFYDDLSYLKMLKSILESDIFSFYISKVSKPYSKSYFSTAKNLIQNFSVPSELFSCNDNLYKIYNLNDIEIDYIIKHTF